jgi:hypothetical protein
MEEMKLRPFRCSGVQVRRGCCDEEATRRTEAERAVEDNERRMMFFISSQQEVYCKFSVCGGAIQAHTNCYDLIFPLRIPAISSNCRQEEIQATFVRAINSNYFL